MPNIEKKLAGLSPEKRELLAQYLQAKTANLLEYINPDRFSGIEKAGPKEFYPVSPAQKRMYIIHQMEGIGTSYNMFSTITVEGALDIHRLEETFRKLIQRHEVFRMSFEMANGELVQKIHQTAAFAIRRWEAGADEVGEIIKDFIKPFDLKQAPLLRAGLIRLSETNHILLFDMPHIISDGASVEILVEEFIKIYKGETLPELRVQYKDFSEWQSKRIQSEAIQKQEAYWLDTFAGEIPVLELPTDYPRPAVMNFEGGMVKLEVDAETTAKLKQYSAQRSATLFMTLLAAYNVLLARLTGQEDIITGTPVTGRWHADLQNIIGPFVNTVVLRNYPQFEITFEAFLEAVRRNTLAAFKNQDYQFETLLEKLELKRDLSRNPLFDTVFNYQNTSVIGGDQELPGAVRFMPYESEITNTKFDITLYVDEYQDIIWIHCNYRTSLFKKTTIEYIMNEYCRLLKIIAANPRLKIKEYPIFLRSDLPAVTQPVIPEVAYEPFPGEAVRQSIGRYFETQVEKYRDRVAVKTDSGTWSYGVLNAGANRIAWELIQRQAAGQTVALLFEHGAGMITAMLGALKAGCIYVPLDPDYPVERLKFMLKDSQALRLITNNANLTRAEALSHPDRGLQIINVDKLDTPDTNPDLEIQPETMAYIIYTSGSTGNPKGVIQTHRNILKFAGEFINLLHLNSGDRLALFTSYSHTVAVIDIFSALFCGAAVYPYDVKYSGDMAQMVRWLKEERITVYHSVPTVYRYCMDALNKDERLLDMRLVVLGGEAVHQRDVERYREHFGDDCILVNLFGSSEVLIATAYLVNKTTELTKPLVPIGYPVPGVDIYLLNQDNRETGVYGNGELVYRSEFLAPGYWRLAAKTREVFTADPLKHDGTVYRSGDWGRLLPDGTLEYIGRKDQQVKIRGYRIELSEIENALETLEGIKQCAVIAKQKPDGESILAGYYVTLEGRTVPAEEIRKELYKKLPDYMIPTYLQQLAELPLTPNGKIDRLALPEPEENPMAGSNYEAPRNEMEAKLAKIWQEVFGVAKLSIHDNFYDLGGHSLTALRITDKAKQLGLNISVKDILSLKTIAKICANAGHDLAINAASQSNSKRPEVSPERPNLLFYTLKESYQYEIDDSHTKVLRIKLHNENTSFLHHFLPLSVILSDDRLIPWYYEHYINIYSHLNDSGLINLDFLEYYGPYKEIMHCVYLGYNFFKDVSNIIDFVINKINQGYYLIINVDEYYLPVKSNYQKEHFVHQSLVYGYHNPDRKLMAVGFNHEDLLAAFTFDYEQFAAAFENGKIYYTEAAPWAENNAVELLKLKDYSKKYPFSLERFLLKLDNYLSSAGDEPIIFTYMLDETNVKYGLSVYDEVIHHLENALKGQYTIAYKTIHFFAEHKKGIFNRLQYIVAQYEIMGDLPEMVQEYYQIVEQFESLRKKFLECHRATATVDFESFAALVKNAVERLKSLKEREKTLLGTISKQLKYFLSPKVVIPETNNILR